MIAEVGGCVAHPDAPRRQGGRRSTKRVARCAYGNGEAVAGLFQTGRWRLRLIKSRGHDRETASFSSFHRGQFAVAGQKRVQVNQYACRQSNSFGSALVDSLSTFTRSVVESASSQRAYRGKPGQFSFR